MLSVKGGSNDDVNAVAPPVVDPDGADAVGNGVAAIDEPCGREKRTSCSEAVVMPVPVPAAVAVAVPTAAGETRAIAAVTTISARLEVEEIIVEDAVVAAFGVTVFVSAVASLHTLGGKAAEDDIDVVVRSHFVTTATVFPGPVSAAICIIAEVPTASGIIAEVCAAAAMAAVRMFLIAPLLAKFRGHLPPYDK